MREKQWVGEGRGEQKALSWQRFLLEREVKQGTRHCQTKYAAYEVVISAKGKTQAGKGVGLC